MSLRERIAKLEQEREGLQLRLRINTRQLKDLRHQLAVEPTEAPGKDCSETNPVLRQLRDSEG